MPWPNREIGAPSGWLLCNGGEYPGPGASGYDEYWQLYQEIGTTYNTGGETTNHFRVPNLQDRLIVDVVVHWETKVRRLVVILVVRQMQI